MITLLKNSLITSLTALSLSIGALSLPTAAHGSSIGVEPLFLEIAPNRSGAIRVRNTSDSEIPVEVMVYRRTVDTNGKQTKTPADDDFILFPPQASLKGQATQVFRLQPIVEITDISQSYYITVRQIPVPMDELDLKGVQLQVVFAFDAAVHVVPRKTEGQLEIINTRLNTVTLEQPTGEFEEKGNGRRIEITRPVTLPAIELDVKNTGSKYLYLQDYDFSADLAGNAETQALDPKWGYDEVVQAAIITLVEPQKSRTFKLPLPAGTQADSVSVSAKKRSGT